MVDILIDSVCLRLSVHYSYVTSNPSNWILINIPYTRRTEYFFKIGFFLLFYIFLTVHPIRDFFQINKLMHNSFIL